MTLPAERTPVNMAHDETRTALVNRILGEWAKKKLHEATLIANVMRGNPENPEAAGKGAE